MNQLEIGQEVKKLIHKPFDRGEFPYQFLECYDNKTTTLERLRTGDSNKSDIDGAILQALNIHLLACDKGEVANSLKALRESPATKRHKAKFILATDGEELEAEDMFSGEVLVCTYAELADKYHFFLRLAGIALVQYIEESPFDTKATRRLNTLYLELLKNNPSWGTDENRTAMNHFMAQLIFCFFAEDTGIFHGENRFSLTLEQFSAKDSSDTAFVIAEIFRAMNTALDKRKTGNFEAWAEAFPYVNGGLFGGSLEVPLISKTARSLIRNCGALDWKMINPDIFGSMIQAVADDDERSELGMHYTSVPNILKVLNPLFLDDLNEKLEEAGVDVTLLMALRKRIRHIRVFDPACGSGNFLVIAYKQLREIEDKINARLSQPKRKSDIPLTNFRGIELKAFPAEIARLALIIAEFQSNVLYLGEQEAKLRFLPLDKMNWITCDNALRVDWLALMDIDNKGVKIWNDDLFGAPLEQALVTFENKGGEIYICGNPPYLGSTWQTKEQKFDLERIFEGRVKNWKSLDYVAGWFMKAADFGMHTKTISAFVSTNSICQGQQVPILWKEIFKTGNTIHFAHTSFKWANLASHKAGVTVVIVGLSKEKGMKKLFSVNENGQDVVKHAETINAYLVAGKNVIVEKSAKPLNGLHEMDFGNKPVDGGNLLLTRTQMNKLGLNEAQKAKFIKQIYGSEEFINGKQRYCLWIKDENLEEALAIEPIKKRIEAVKEMRLESTKAATRLSASKAHSFGEVRQWDIESTLIVPRVSSENRDFLPVGLIGNQAVISDRNFALYDAPLWNMALIASRLHWVWIGTVCVRMEMRFSYSNTLGWNTFPVPSLTSNEKAALTECAENILLAREVHYPKTIADLYDVKTMPQNLRDAHAQNDETLERIYIGRTFKNDTERLEKLFELYTKMTSLKGLKQNG